MLAAEVVATLAPRPGETYVDCTAGLGGHAALIASAMEGRGTVVLNDADPANLEHATARVKAVSPDLRVLACRGNFAELPHTLRAQGLRADMVLADLGFASTQVDDAARGFSFMKEGPLDMRLDPALPFSAADLVGSMSERELAEVIERYGEEKQARRIARKLCQARASEPIRTTSRLAELVSSCVARVPGGIHPATKTFQALRIAVNDEIGSLEALLGFVGEQWALRGRDVADRWLGVGGRVAIIAFHSLEDRPVKEAMQGWVREGATDLTNGLVTATEAEIAGNPRSRSAKLRAVRL